MVLFVDLEDESAEPPDLTRMGIGEKDYMIDTRGGHGDWRDFHNPVVDNDNQHLQVGRYGEERPNPNNNAMTEALGCYP